MPPNLSLHPPLRVVSEFVRHLFFLLLSIPAKMSAAYNVPIWNATASFEQMHLNTGLLVKLIIHKCSCHEAWGIWTQSKPGKICCCTRTSSHLTVFSIHQKRFVAKLSSLLQYSRLCSLIKITLNYPENSCDIDQIANFWYYCGQTWGETFVLSLQTVHRGKMRPWHNSCCHGAPFKLTKLETFHDEKLIHCWNLAIAVIFIGHLKWECGPWRVNSGDSEVKSRHNYHFQFQTRRDAVIWRPFSSRAREGECLDGGLRTKG